MHWETAIHWEHPLNAIVVTYLDLGLRAVQARPGVALVLGQLFVVAAREYIEYDWLLRRHVEERKREIRNERAAVS